MKESEIRIDRLIPTQREYNGEIEEELNKAHQQDKVNLIPAIAIIKHPSKEGFYLIADGHTRAYIALINRRTMIRAKIAETAEDLFELDIAYSHPKNVSKKEIDFQYEVCQFLEDERNMIAEGIMTILDLKDLRLDFKTT